MLAAEANQGFGDVGLRQVVAGIQLDRTLEMTQRRFGLAADPVEPAQIVVRHPRARILAERVAPESLFVAIDSELACVRAAMRGELDALAGSRLAGRGEPLSLADLVAWESRIDAVREWPVDAPVLLRFAIYAAIPLGSWLGGALVEHMLGAVLE